MRELLIASHIIPWNAAESHRLDPQNGIALNALHDRAFDRGLITFDTELRLVCTSSLRDHFADAPACRSPGEGRTIAQYFQVRRTADKPLTLPAEVAGPRPAYLAGHREVVVPSGRLPAHSGRGGSFVPGCCPFPFSAVSAKTMKLPYPVGAEPVLSL